MAKTGAFTREDVERIAKLSNINLSDKELDFFTQVFADTVEYIKILDEINTQDVQPTFQVTGLPNVFQTKGMHATLTQDEALQNASSRIKDKFATRGVFDREH